MKIAIKADKYFNNKPQMDNMAMMGMEIQPVDLNAGLVVPKQDKFGMCDACGKEVQDNIQERFGLQTPNEGGE